MKTIQVKESFQLDIKRFYAPIKFECKCICGSELVFDANDKSLACPSIGEKENMVSWCETCDEFMSIDVVINMSVDVNEDSIKTY